MDDEPILDCIVVATSTRSSTMAPTDDASTTASPALAEVGDPACASGALEQSRTTTTPSSSGTTRPKKTAVPTAATAAPGTKRTPTWAFSSKVLPARRSPSATLVRERLHKRDHDNSSPPNSHQARGQQSVRYSGDQRKMPETPGQTERATDKNQPRFEPNDEVIVISSDNDEVDSDDEPLAAVRKRKTTSPNPSERPQKKRAPAQTHSTTHNDWATRDLASEGSPKKSGVVDANKTKKDCELARLKKEMRHLEQRNSVMAALDASMNACITTLQDEAAQAKEDLAQANIAHEKQVTELQKRLEDTGADLRREQESSKGTGAKISKLETSNKELEEKVSSQSVEIQGLREEVTWYEGRLEIRNKERHEGEMEWRDYLLALDNNNNISLAERRRAAPIPAFNEWLGERRL